MKKFVLLSLAIGLAILSMAQAPQLINYQAVIRDATGQVIQNQNVSLRLSIHEKYSVGINVYQEEHTLKTNDFGLVNIHIGNGVSKIGLLKDVKWGNDVHVLKVSLDQNGGTTYDVMGYSQLVSVPYALYAANVSYADTSASNELQLLSFVNDTLYLSNGNSIYLPNTDYSKNISDLNDSIMVVNGKLVSITQQIKNDSIYLAGLISAHVQNDADMDSTNEIQNLSIAGNTLNISGGNSVTLPTGGVISNDNDSTNEIQSLSRSSDTLFISESNYIVLPSGSVNTDNQNLNISGDTLYIEDGTPVVLTKYLNTDGQSLSLSGNNLSISGGNSIALPAGGSSNDNDSTNELQNLTLSADTMFISKGNYVVLPTGSINTDNQNLNLSGDTLYIEDGTAVLLSKYLDNTDSQNLSIIGNTISISNGNNISLPGSAVNLDNDSTNELNSAVSLSGNTLSITDAGGSKTADLTAFNQSGEAAAVDVKRSSDSAQFSVAINALNTGAFKDSSVSNEIQDLQLIGNALKITNNSAATTINLAAFTGNNTDSQQLSISNDTILLGNGGSVKLPADQVNDQDADSTNEIQSLGFSATTLSLSNGGGTADLSSLKDNTDSQTLSLIGSTLSIIGGNSITLPAGSVNNDNDSTNELNISMALSGSTLSVTDGGGAKTVDVSSLLDNTDAQALSISGNSLSISGGNSVILPAGSASNDNDSTNELNSSVGFSGTTLTVTDAGGAKTTSLASLLDNTDSQNLSLLGNTLSIAGGNSVTLPAGSTSNDNDSTNELNSAVSLSGNILSVTDASGAKTTDLSVFKDNTDSQNLSLSGSTLSIAGGNSVTLPSGSANNDNDSTNELNTAFAISSNNLIVTDAGGAKSVSLAPYLDNTDTQSLSLSGSTLSISGGNNVTLPSGSTYTTRGIDSVLAAGSDAAGLNITNIGSLTVNNGITASTIQLTAGAGVDKILTSDASGNATWSDAKIPAEIKDADNDTKIQVEESADEDIIRFDIAGNERWRMEGARIEPIGTGGSVFIGDNAGQSDDLTNNNNTFIGNNAGQSSTTGDYNVGVGRTAMHLNSTGIQNTTIGARALYNNSTGFRNSSVGFEALFSNGTGLGNTASGYRALRSNSGTNYNSALGYDALYSNSSTGNTAMGAFAGRGMVTGNYNTIMGYAAMYANVTGARNVSIGYNSMRRSVSGSYNTVLGDQALFTNINGSSNVVLGRNAGYSNSSGSENIFLGSNSGYSETGSNKLYIESSNSAAPLIYGDFATDQLKINGDLEVRDDFIFTTGAGAGKILTSDATGTASWTNPGAVSLGDTTQVSDLDGDTKIQMEESSDEDIIRFDLAGTQQWRMIGARLEANNSGLSVFIGQEAGQIDDLSNNQNVFIGYRSGRNNSTGQLNTAIGSNSLANNTSGNYNTSTGYYSLGSNTTGQQNSAYGYYSLGSNTTGAYNAAYGLGSLRLNTSGILNAASGYYALFSNTTGNYNSAFGGNALRLNTTGTRNAAIGYATLYFNTTGYRNSGSGMFALYRNSTGYDNTVTGYYSMGSNTTGYENAAIGANTLYQNTTGNRNAAIGHRAGYYGQTGAQNTYLGSYAGPANNTTYSNATAVGYNVTTTASNQVRIGNSSVSSIGGQVGWSTLSDGRFKENVKSDVVGLDFIMKLEPVTYTLKTEELFSQFEGKDSLEVSIEEVEARIEKSKTIQTGFIAQDVEKAAKKSGYSFSGVDAPKNDKDMYGLRYSEFVVPLVKGMQEQQKLIEAQQELIKKLEKRITALEK